MDGALQTHITSIDPAPRAEIDAICDLVIRAPLEQASLEVFDGLAPGDVVFMDGSHRVFMNNDVAAFFLEDLPNLPAGVLVGIHDIYLPFDYPADIADRYYSEQYMLAAYLLGGPPVKLVLPAHLVFTTLPEHIAAVWEAPAFRGVEPHGVAFWLEVESPSDLT